MELVSNSLWCLKRIYNLFVVCIRILLFCSYNPKQLYLFLFTFYSYVNRFYQTSHGKLAPFEKTDLYRKIKDNMVFAAVNYFNIDSRVVRSEELQVLFSIVNYLKPQKIFEIGTYNGLTTLHFACNTPPECTVYTLDLPEDFLSKSKNEGIKYSYDDWKVIQLSNENIHKRMFKGHSCESKIVELFGDSLSFDSSPYWGTVDLIYIDGNHSYQWVSSDTQNAFKMLSENGVIIWHDFDFIVHEDVFKFLNQLVKEHKIYFIANTRFAIYGKNL